MEKPGNDKTSLYRCRGDGNGVGTTPLKTPSALGNSPGRLGGGSGDKFTVKGGRPAYDSWRVLLGVGGLEGNPLVVRV